MRNHLLKSIFISLILAVGVSNAWGGNDFTEGVVVYFDNTITKWSNIYLRVGHSGYNSAYQLTTKVNGTDALYKYTIPSWGGYDAFSFANNAGETGSKTIYQPSNYKNNSKYPSGQTTYFSGWNLDKMRLFIPTGVSNTDDKGCTYYNTDVEYNNYKRSVTIQAPSNGSIKITYIDENGTNQTKNSGSFNVAQTCKITVTATPNSGYKLKSLTIGESNFTSGGTYIVRANTTVKATFEAQTYTITYKDQNNATFSGLHASGYPTQHTYGTTTTLKTASKAGYTFDGWHTNAACTNKVTSLGATAYTANIILYAKWTLNATYSLEVVAGNGISTVEGSKDPVTLGNTYDIKATSKTGYTFSTWTANPASNATFGSATTAETTVTVNNGSVIVTASAKEVLSTLTTANEYNEGTPTIAAPKASVAKIGVTTTATVTAAAGTGYTFAGWKLDNCVRTDAGADNATTITVKSNGDGADAKVTAKYEQNVVYFVNTKGWSTVKVYAWNDGGAANAEWSGVALTDANIVKQIGGCDVYKYVPGANYAKVIFNNGSEKTDDLAWQNGKYYVYNSENSIGTNDWYDESQVEGVLPRYKTIYLNTGGSGFWDQGDAKFFVHVWGGGADELDAQMEKLENEIYQVEVAASHAKIIFLRQSKETSEVEWNKDDGLYNKTANLDIPADKNCYTITGWGENDGTWSNLEYYVTGNKELVGEANAWKADAISMTYENGVFSHTFENVPEGQECKLKVTGGSWSKAWGYKELSKYIEGVTYDGNDNNACFTLKKGGNVTVTFNGKQITDITTTGEFVSPIYTIVGAEPLMGYNFDVNQNQMTRVSATEYTLERTVALPVGTYEYRVAQNYQYLWSVPADGNATLKIDKSGTGKVKFTLDPSKPEVTTELIDWVEGEVSHVVKLSGIGNEDIPFSQSADNLSTSAEVTLDANKVYEFNVIVDGTYTYNQGNMWRGNCTGWTFQTAAEGNNAHIITDLAGTYTFTWTYGPNKQLTVTYPDDGTNVPVPVFLAGGMNSWDRLATRLIPDADGETASAKVELERNVYNDFRMVVGTEDWTNTGTMDRGNHSDWVFVKVTEDNDNKDVNAGIIPDVTGEYIFTWSYADNKLSVTYPEKTCTDCSSWYLCGSFNEWGLANEFTIVDDKTVTTTVRLEAGEYKFKVQDMTNPRDGKWWGNKGKMQRNSDGLTTGWTFEQKSGDDYNCTIVADIAGDYIFTWNTDTKKLTVQYPTPTITLTDGNNSDIIEENKDKTVNVVLNRSFVAKTGYYTLCVPFDMSASEIGTAYQLGTITKNVAGEGIIINLNEVENILAGVAYLVLPNQTVSELLVKGVNIKDVNPTTLATVSTGAGIKITFTGIINGGGQTNGTTEYYVGDNGYLYNGKVSKLGLRAFFTITDDADKPISGLRARVVAQEDEATGVEDITAPEGQVLKVIENGQLIIIRNGEKYNVQGVRL